MGHDRRSRPDRREGTGLWVGSIVDDTGRRAATLNIDGDLVYPLTRATAMAHAALVLNTAAEAEHTERLTLALAGPTAGLSVEAAAMLVSEVAHSAPVVGLSWPTEVRLGVVSDWPRALPLITVAVPGRLVATLRPRDARAHACAVVEAVRVAELDGATDRRLHAVLEEGVVGRVLARTGAPVQ